MRRHTFIAPAFALALLLALPFSSKGILGIIVAIGGLIFVHELGHFLAAKRMGMPVETFSLGFGPRIWSFRWKETEVRLALLPLGGYVKLAGYNPENPDDEDPHGFLQQPYRKRMLFYAGGIIGNVLAAFLLLWVVEADQARILTWKTLSVDVQQPIPGKRAALGGLKGGDKLQRLGDLNYPQATWEDTVTYIRARPETPIPVTVTRDGRDLNLVLTPANENGIGMLGVTPFARMEVPDQMRPFGWRDIGTGFVNGAKGLTFRTMIVGYSLWRLASFQASVHEVGGPGAIGAQAYKAAKIGWRHFLAFVAFLSINLAVLNALPIPFLDGGHMAILSFEKLRRKDLSIQLKERILTAGLVFLASLMLFVIALDILKLRH